jgi:hypothetical protein
MQPDRTNYEIWLIDYLDGTLDETRVNQLISFLDENPDIKEEFSEILTYNIKPVTGSFKHKNSLKKSASDLSEKQFEYLCISAAENDLSEQQKEELETIVAENPEMRKTFELINRLKLVAPVVKYNKKSGLKKITTTKKIVRLSVIGLSAAAGIAILISLFNVPADKKDAFKSFTPANLTGDYNEVKTNANKIAANINTDGKKEIPNPGRINALSTLQKTIPDEIKPYPAKTLTNDPTAANTEIRQVNISKLDFKQDVSMGGKEFTGTLIAIKKDVTSAPEIPETPSFNKFIVKTLREKILKSKTHESGSLKAYEIADAGINGLNKLLGWQMSLQKTRDDKGDLKSLYFSSKILKFNAPVKKVQLGS